MEHLLYSSNEMYSSTELIRKSKTIFDKIINEEIDKAIILRDGKPSFMLLDFDKYEKIMAEYDILKANKKNKIKTAKKEVLSEEPIQIIQEKVIEHKVKKSKKPSSKVVPPKPIYTSDEEEALNDEKELTEANKIEIAKKTETEVQQGLEVLDNLDFDDEFKKQVEEKVRLRKEAEISVQKSSEKKIELESRKEERKANKAEITEFWS